MQEGHECADYDCKGGDVYGERGLKFLPKAVQALDPFWWKKLAFITHA